MEITMAMVEEILETYEDYQELELSDREAKYLESVMPDVRSEIMLESSINLALINMGYSQDAITGKWWKTKESEMDIDWSLTDFADNILRSEVYNKLDLFKFELDKLEESIEGPMTAVGNINDYLISIGHYFDMGRNVWDRHLDRAEKTYLDMATAEVRNNTDLEPVTLSREDFKHLVYTDEYFRIGRYDNLEDYLMELVVDLDRGLIDEMEIYRLVVNNDVYFYEVPRITGFGQLLFVVEK